VVDLALAAWLDAAGLTERPAVKVFHLVAKLPELAG
jgi:hypothetical protein